MQSSKARNSSDGRVIHRGLWVPAALTLSVLILAVALIGMLRTNDPTQGGQAALGGVGVLLVSLGSVVLARGR